MSAGQRNRVAGYLCEPMERRLMLCMADEIIENPMMIQPTYNWVKPTRATNRGGPEAVADIVWTNRGQSSDRFASTFGANAAAARAVVDAVIAAWERVITNFNYSDGSGNYNVTISMDSAGTSRGASANVSTYLNGKPKSGVITMGRGLDTTGDGLGDGAGWFIDPTPNDHSEFLGHIANAFAGDAPSTSPAFNLSDFYGVVAAEMTHCMGLIHHSQAAFQSGGFNTNLNVADTADGGGVGFFYKFISPSIKHLMTSNNGGSGGSDFGAAVHSAGPGVSVNSAGFEYQGADDVGNATYEGSRRYLVNDVFASVFNSAYGYTVQMPQQFGTFYAMLNENTGELLIRGSDNDFVDSHDIITIFGAGASIDVSVDVDVDIAGTGALSGSGDLPAFVSSFNSALVTSIRIESGSGADVINLNSIKAGIPVSIDTGVFADTVNIGGGDFDSNIKSAVTIDFGPGPGSDRLVFDDDADNTGADTYTISATTIGKTGFETVPAVTFANMESLTLDANGFDNVINVDSQPVTGSFTVNGNGGNDTFNVGGGMLGESSSANFNGGTGTNTIFFNDANNALFGQTYTLTASELTKTLGGDKNYSNFQSMTISCGSAGNTININGVAAGTPVTVSGNGGGDTFNVGNGDIDANILGNITLNGNASTDTVIFNDTTDNVGSDAYTLSNVMLSKATGGDITYLGVESLRLDASSNGDTFDVQSISAVTPSIINCGNGNDVVSVGGGDFDAGMLTGLQVRGDAGTDSLVINDTADLGAGSYNIDTGFVGKSTTFTGVSYQTLESVTVNASASSSTFDIDGTSAGVPITVNGNDGDDLFNINAPPASALTINGGNPTSGSGDHAVIIGTSTTAAIYRPSAITPGSGTVEVGGQIVAFSGLENSNNELMIDTMLSLTVITLNSADIIDINSLSGNGLNIISGTSGGIAIADTQFKNVANVVLNTGASDAATPDDVVTIHPNGLLATGLQTFRFIGGTSAANDDTLTVLHGTFAFATDAAVDTRNLTLNVNTDSTNAASVTFNATQHLAALNLGTGGAATMSANGGRVLVTKALSIPSGAKLDLTNNDLIVDYPGASQLAAIQALILSARAGGAWTGTSGIGSASAAAAVPKNTTLGAIEASQFKSIYGAAAPFTGETIDTTAVLVKYTYYGDVDFNGVVDFDDYSRIDAGFNNNRTGWLNGDVDGNGIVDFDDYSVIDQAFNTQTGIL